MSELKKIKKNQNKKNKENDGIINCFTDKLLLKIIKLFKKKSANLCVFFCGYSVTIFD